MNAKPITVGSYEAKTKLPELLERAASGEEITIHQTRSADREACPGNASQ